MNVNQILKNWDFTTQGQTEKVTVPHDFMLATERTPDSPTGSDYGFFQPCKGEYRMTLKKTPAPRHVLRFDGVMGLTEVLVNGSLVKMHPYGYTTFLCDISDRLKDGDNDLLVRVDATMQPASRWYTGAGIYRQVELLTSEEDYIVPDSVFLRTERIYGDSAGIRIDIRVFSRSDQTATLTFTAEDAGFSLERHVKLVPGENSFSFAAMLHKITVWTQENPILYHCEVTLATDCSKDCDSADFGVRTVDCDPSRGFLLNGVPVKLYGACVHHDNGIVGAASFYSSETRRVRILKANGFNAIRCSHNPPSQAFLDACDRAGMLVIDEVFDCWTRGKMGYDYHLWFEKNAEEDIVSTVVRGRNHPSVVMWSTGNEIYERAGLGGGYDTGKMIADTIRKYDPTRPVTHAFCHFWDDFEYNRLYNETWENPAEQMDFWCEKIAPQAGNLDVLGYNYLTHRVEKDKVRFPQHLFAITESYPMDAVYVKKEMDRHTQLIGEFVWTGWDYFGETGLGRVIYDQDTPPQWGLLKYPEYISNCGDFDICGFKKPQSFYRDAAWKEGSVHILTEDPDYFDRKRTFSAWGFYGVNRTWTYPGKENKKATVHLYTTADECELWQDGVSLGRKAPNEKGVAEFETVYRAGTLTAKSYIDGKVTGEDSLTTTGEPVSMEIKFTETQDLLYAEITLLDADGAPAWTGDEEITVTAVGGKVIGTGSGLKNDPHRYTDNVCRTHHGRLLAAVLPQDAAVTVTASCKSFTVNEEYKA